MHRIDGAGNAGGKWVDEDVATGRQPTVITPDWMNAVQEELASLIEWAGLALNKGDNTQLRQALLAKFQRALGFAPVQQGGGAGQLNNKIFIGWSGGRLKAQVDQSDLGSFVFSDSPTLTGIPVAPTPPVGTNTQQIATAAFVQSTVRDAVIGQIVWEPRASVRAGCLKLNGALVRRNDYPVLWAYAQTSGALVSEQEWQAGRWGCFSSGDGVETFRVPELRGEFVRAWADGRDDVDSARTLGSWQVGQNLSHSHGASAGEVADHVHNAWTDGQGSHAHGGGTGGAGYHNHEMPSSPGVGSGAGGANSVQQSSGTTLTASSGYHNHGIAVDGLHGHNIGIGSAGRHSHAITINVDGGNEARPRNVAMLAMIRAY